MKYGNAVVSFGSYQSNITPKLHAAQSEVYKTK